MNKVKTTEAIRKEYKDYIDHPALYSEDQKWAMNMIAMTELLERSERVISHLGGLPYEEQKWLSDFAKFQEGK